MRRRGSSLLRCANMPSLGEKLHAATHTHLARSLFKTELDGSRLETARGSPYRASIHNLARPREDQRRRDPVSIAMHAVQRSCATLFTDSHQQPRRCGCGTLASRTILYAVTCCPLSMIEGKIHFWKRKYLEIHWTRPMKNVDSK